MSLCTHMLLSAHTSHAMPGGDQEQLLEIFLPCGSWRLNSGCQAWFLLVELSPWCSLLIFNLPYSNVKYVFIVVEMVYIIFCCWDSFLLCCVAQATPDTLYVLKPTTLGVLQTPDCLTLNVLHETTENLKFIWRNV